MDNENRIGNNVSNNESKSNFDVETLQALMFQANDSAVYKPSEKQVDKILELREKAMDYTFKERTSLHPKDILKTITLFGVILSFLIILWITVENAPEYTDAVIASIISLVGGGFTGYGLGRSKTDVTSFELEN